MLVQRLRRWPNIKPTLGQRPWFDSLVIVDHTNAVFIRQLQ